MASNSTNNSLSRARQAQADKANRNRAQREAQRQQQIKTETRLLQSTKGTTEYNKAHPTGVEVTLASGEKVVRYGTKSEGGWIDVPKEAVDAGMVTATRTAEGKPQITMITPAGYDKTIQKNQMANVVNAKGQQVGTAILRTNVGQAPPARVQRPEDLSEPLAPLIERTRNQPVNYASLLASVDEQTNVSQVSKVEKFAPSAPTSWIFEQPNEPSYNRQFMHSSPVMTAPVTVQPEAPTFTPYVEPSTNQTKYDVGVPKEHFFPTWESIKKGAIPAGLTAGGFNVLWSTIGTGWVGALVEPTPIGEAIMTGVTVAGVVASAHVGFQIIGGQIQKNIQKSSEAKAQENESKFIKENRDRYLQGIAVANAEFAKTQSQWNYLESQPVSELWFRDEKEKARAKEAVKGFYASQGLKGKELDTAVSSVINQLDSRSWAAGWGTLLPEIGSNFAGGFSLLKTGKNIGVTSLKELGKLPFLQKAGLVASATAPQGFGESQAQFDIQMTQLGFEGITKESTPNYLIRQGIAFGTSGIFGALIGGTAPSKAGAKAKIPYLASIGAGYGADFPYEPGGDIVSGILEKSGGKLGKLGANIITFGQGVNAPVVSKEQTSLSKFGFDGPVVDLVPSNTGVYSVPMIFVPPSAINNIATPINILPVDAPLSREVTSPYVPPTDIIPIIDIPISVMPPSSPVPVPPTSGDVFGGDTIFNQGGDTFVENNVFTDPTTNTNVFTDVFADVPVMTDKNMLPIFPFGGFGKDAVAGYSGGVAGKRFLNELQVGFGLLGSMGLSGGFMPKPLKRDTKKVKKGKKTKIKAKKHKATFGFDILEANNNPFAGVNTGIASGFGRQNKARRRTQKVRKAYQPFYKIPSLNIRSVF